ncbi:MAG: hypothetical protein JWM47_228 [Acidimicrobiales bacterium]|nr:hypothetical protein [Acidimicrobiales bacterium]
MQPALNLMVSCVGSEFTFTTASRNDWRSAALAVLSGPAQPTATSSTAAAGAATPSINEVPTSALASSADNDR